MKIKKAKVISFWKVVQNTKRAKPRQNTLFHSKTSSNYRDIPAFPSPSLYQASKKDAAKIVISMDERKKGSRTPIKPSSNPQIGIPGEKKPLQMKGSSITITLFDSLHDAASLTKQAMPKFLKSSKPVVVAADSPHRSSKKERFDRESLELEHNIYNTDRGFQEKNKPRPTLARSDLNKKNQHFIDFDALGGPNGKTTFN